MMQRIFYDTRKILRLGRITGDAFTSISHDSRYLYRTKINMMRSGNNDNNNDRFYVAFKF